MLVMDERIAESLVEMTPARCLVLAARALHEKRGPCTSPYECCACAMPAVRADAPCEMCGRENFRPVQSVQREVRG